MTRRADQRRALHVAILAAGWLSVGCGQLPDDPLPEPRLPTRQAALAIVGQQSDRLKTADGAQAAAALSHPDARVRVMALRRLATLGPRAASKVTRVVAKTRDPDATVRIQAAVTLAALKDRQGVEPLIRLLADPDRTVRLWAWKALVRLQDLAMPAMLLQLEPSAPLGRLSYRDEAGNQHRVGEVIAARIAESAPKKMVARLVTALERPALLGPVARLLRDFGPKGEDALPLLIAGYRETSDPQLRHELVRTIGTIGDLHPAVMPTLIDASKSADPRLAKAGQTALDEIAKSHAKTAERTK